MLSVALGLTALLAGCSEPQAGPSATASAPTAAGPNRPTVSAPASTEASSQASSQVGAEPTVSEPTTTNTLPAPPDPTGPAASAAGRLTAAALPVPAGWHTVAKKGEQEEGYLGNGTWVHARDPRYAATDTITVGCAAVTRDDFTDPRSALEGTYQNGTGDPGIGLALDFATATAASRYFRLYTEQVDACTDPDGPMVATVLRSDLGLIDHRTYPGDEEWTEVVRQQGRRVTLVILTDPGHRIGRADAEAILRSIPG